jgi:hypothetical protein
MFIKNIDKYILTQLKINRKLKFNDIIENLLIINNISYSRNIKISYDGLFITSSGFSKCNNIDFIIPKIDNNSNIYDLKDKKIIFCKKYISKKSYFDIDFDFDYIISLNKPNNINNIIQINEDTQELTLFLNKLYNNH